MLKEIFLAFGVISSAINNFEERYLTYLRFHNFHIAFLDKHFMGKSVPEVGGELIFWGFLAITCLSIAITLYALYFSQLFLKKKNTHSQP